MKRILATLLILTLFISLCACGGKAKNIIAVEEAINQIGVVTLDSVDAIKAAEDLYNALTDEEKAQVENYNILQQAKNELENLQSERCIPGTYFEFPEYILTVPNKGAWIVNKDEDFIAYNLWPETETYAKQGFAQYKAYISERTNIHEVDPKTFTFVNDEGKLITVILQFNSNSCILQIRVPKN